MVDSDGGSAARLCGKALPFWEPVHTFFRARREAEPRGVREEGVEPEARKAGEAVKILLLSIKSNTFGADSSRWWRSS